MMGKRATQIVVVLSILALVVATFAGALMF